MRLNEKTKKHNECFKPEHGLDAFNFIYYLSNCYFIADLANRTFPFLFQFMTLVGRYIVGTQF